MTGFTTMFTGRCPCCNDGRLFSGVLTLNDRCPSCGAVFMRDPGSWTGTTAVSYMAACVFIVGLLLVMWSTGNLGPGAEWTVVGLTLTFQLLTMRMVKGYWVGMLYDMEQVYPDPTPPNT